MTKEKLINELENYKTLYKVEKEKREQLENERENIATYQLLNLDLQVKVKELQETVKSLEKYNEMLSNQNQTYETTFNILKGSDK